MAPSPIPAPLPPWAKVGLFLLPYAVGFLEDLLQYKSTHATPDPLEWRRLMVRFSDNISANAADDQFVTFDIANITGGSIDASWTTTDYTTCETAFNTMFNTLKTKMASHLTIDRYSWYRRVFNPLSETKPFADTGPPERVTAVSYAGTAVSSQAAQVSCTVTEKTPWPKHWGRYYLPGGAAADLTGAGYWSNAYVDLIQGLGQTLYTNLANAEFYQVVPVTQVNRDPTRLLLGVSQVQVDNVPDIIRRRRLRDVTYRKVGP